MTPGDLTSVPRSWLERVLDTVRLLGATQDLPATLEQIAEAVTEVLGFSSVAINVAQPDGSVVVVSARGAGEALLGESTPIETWERLLADCDEINTLRCLRHGGDEPHPRGGGLRAVVDADAAFRGRRRPRSLAPGRPPAGADAGGGRSPDRRAQRRRPGRREVPVR